MSATRIAVLVEAQEWRKTNGAIARDIRQAARAALILAPKSRLGAVTIVLADDARLEVLNRQFRGKNVPTNVLSFPSDDPSYLGDIAIAHGVTAREARESGKTIHDHALHLAVHGVLHLLGYDHETARDARIMEPLEAAILAKLGIADPYAARPQAVSAQ